MQIEEPFSILALENLVSGPLLCVTAVDFQSRADTTLGMRLLTPQLCNPRSTSVTCQ